MNIYKRHRFPPKIIQHAVIKINGAQHYLWRAVDQDGDVIDVFLQERGMRKFKSIPQAQRFLSTHAEVYNLFNLGRHLVSAKNYCLFRDRAFASWGNAVSD